tara:strand:- start:690 stop:2180 length:1491 start_codon:yes stop_codon:yes gene_type:complete
MLEMENENNNMRDMKIQMDRMEKMLLRILAIVDEPPDEPILENNIVLTKPEPPDDDDDDDDFDNDDASSQSSEKKHANNHLLVDGLIWKGGKTTTKSKCLTIHATTTDDLIDIEKILNKIYNVNLDMLTYVSCKKKDMTNVDWVDCPEYLMCEELLNSPSFKFHYTDMTKFNKLIKQLGSPKIKQYSVWFPNRIPQLETLSKLKYVDCKLQPKYPIYIISKGRWEKTRRLTINWLIKCNIDFKVIVEPDEYDNYVKEISSMGMWVGCVVKLPDEYANQGQGSIPARNFAMYHSQKYDRCWILDDNINGYMWNNHSQRVPVESGNVFSFIEEYTDKFTNVLISGHEYTSNVNYDMKIPVMKNRRVFSSILIDNKIADKLGEGWRGIYNEDVDICIRTLKAGYTTLLFNNITSNKTATSRMRGGNTDGIYALDGNGSGVLKTQSLIDQHPECVKPVIKYKPPRTHHKVNWDLWKDNEIKYRHNHAEVSKSYDMTLVKR